MQIEKVETAAALPSLFVLSFTIFRF